MSNDLAPVPIVRPPSTGVPAFPLDFGTVYFDRPFLSGGIDHFGVPRVQDSSLSRSLSVAALRYDESGVVQVQNFDPDYPLHIAAITETSSAETYRAVELAADITLLPGETGGHVLSPGNIYRLAVAPPNYVVLVSVPHVDQVTADRRAQDPHETQKRRFEAAEKTIEASKRLKSYLSVNERYRHALTYEFHQYLAGYSFPEKMSVSDIKKYFKVNPSDVHREIWRRIITEEWERGSPMELLRRLAENRILTHEDVVEVSQVLAERGHAALVPPS
ncbi:hypothetical protein EV580_6698 [Mycobacterium sp. BK086]|uniref:hypothetical protein n=1 Tax=Mycobacterium sp. BK086 TaxID=2512165 RepID=UPI00105D039A|nr:hypothetical protein [Mycobacterium sp. BK086]TDO06598.1 hypothetical protein EV580_6698 [Mycobacterium sp. BK086]